MKVPVGSVKITAGVLLKSLPYTQLLLILIVSHLYKRVSDCLAEFA
jgi:hypothetical protein